MNQVNTFDLSRVWFEYVSENINIKPVHTHLYFFIINKWNILFWKKQIGIPTEHTMQSLNIRSYKTYINALNDLEDFGFITFIERSRNQNTSNIIEVVNNTKAESNPNTKALIKAGIQSEYQSEYQINDSIDKPINKELINYKTNKQEEIKFPFGDEDFLKMWKIWKDYKKKEFNFKYKSSASEQGALKQLAKTANNNKETAIKILEQSISNGWKGFFELKNQKNDKQNSELGKVAQEYAKSLGYL